MDTVWKKGSGTWDYTQNRWELKKLGICKTPKQLADALGEPVPEGKIASRAFWDKYLAAFQRADTAKKRQRSHLQERLQSLDVIIESLEAPVKGGVKPPSTRASIRCNSSFHLMRRSRSSCCPRSCV